MKKEILHLKSAPYCPSENGKVENHIKTLKYTTKALLTTSMLSKGYWSYAVRYATHIMNVLPRKGQKASPFEKVYGRKPDYSRFHVFGAKGIYIPAKRTKFNENPSCRFLGMAESSKTYLILDISSRKVIRTRDIKIDDAGILKHGKHKFRSDLDQSEDSDDESNDFTEEKFE